MKKISKIFLLLIPFFIVTYIAIDLGIKSLFFGYYGDAQMQIWQSYNLFKILSLPTSILTDSFYGTPYPYALSLSSILQNSFIYILFVAIKNIYIAYNFSVAFFLYLNFVSMYYVLRKMGANKTISWITGLIFFLAPSTILHSLGHPSVFIVFMFPLFFYCLYRILLKSSLINYLSVAVIIACTFYVHEYYSIAVVTLFALFICIQIPEFIKKQINILYLTVSCLLILILLIPFFNLYADKIVFDHENQLVLSRSLDEMVRFSSSLINFFFPANENILYSLLPKQPLTHKIPSEHLNYLGIVNILTLGYVCYSFIRKNNFYHVIKTNRRWKSISFFVFFSICISIILSCGPYLKIGNLELKMPIYFISQLNLFPFNAIRAYGRYGILFFTLATIITAYVFSTTKIGELLNRKIIILLLVLVIVLDQIPIKKIDYYKLPIPSYLEQIKKDQNYYFVLHLPFSIYYGGLHNATAQLFQVFHHKPIINGYASFLTPLYEKKITTTPIRCIHYPQIFLPSCVNVLNKDVLSQNQIKYIIYEKKTQFYLPGIFEQKLDSELRLKTQERLNEFNLQSVFSDDYYEIYKVY